MNTLTSNYTFKGVCSALVYFYFDIKASGHNVFLSEGLFDCQLTLIATNVYLTVTTCSSKSWSEGNDTANDTSAEMKRETTVIYHQGLPISFENIKLHIKGGSFPPELNTGILGQLSVEFPLEEQHTITCLQ